MAGINVGSVSVTVVPDTGDFVPRLRADLADIPSVKITLDDMEAMGRLDELKARLDELGRKSETVKVNVDTSGASAELEKLKKEMDAATSGSGSAGAGGLSGLVKAAVALSPALLGVGQVATAVGVGVAGAFGAAIGGVGAFALAAKPVITSIDTAATAQEKYNNIVEQYGAKSTQAKAAANQLGLAMAHLTPAEQAAATQMAGFKDAYQSWTQSFDPVILPVFNNGLAIAKSAMKDLTPAIQGAGGALGGVTAQIRQSFASPAVAAQFKTFGAEVTQGIGSLGPVLANIVPAALNLFQAMNPLTTIIEDFLKSVGPQLPALAASLAGPFKTLAATFTQIGPMVGDLLSGLGHTIGGLLGALEPLVPVVLSVVDAFVKMVNNSGVLSFLKQVGGMIGGLLTALSPLIPVVGQLVGILADGLAGALGSIIQALDPVITLIAKSLAPILAPVAQLVAAVADALGHQLGAVITALTPILADLLPVVGRIASSLGTLLTGAIGQLLPVLGGALIDVLKAITPLLPPLANLLGTAITAAVTALAPVVTALAEALAQVLPSLLPLISNLVQGLLPVIKSITPILPELAQLIGTVLVAAVDLLVPVLKLVVEVMNAIPIPVLLPLLVSLVDPILGIVVVITELGSVWGGIWPVISSVLHAAWNDVIKPVFDALTTAGQAIADFFTKTVAPAFAQAWNDITGAFSSAWDWVSGFFAKNWELILGIITGPIGLAVEQIATHWSDITGAFTDAWTWVSKTFAAWWAGLKGLLVTPITDAVTAITGIFDEKGPLVGAFNTVVAAVQTAWNKLEDVAKAPVTFIINTVLNDGLLAAWDDVTDVFDKSLHINPIQLPKGWATGGVLPGYAPGSDTVMAMLSPGEAILRPEVARWLGADTIHGLNRAAVTGGLPHFSGGGVWGDITGAASDVGGAIGGAAGAVGGAIGGAVSDSAGWVKDHLNPVDWLVNAIKGPLGQLSQITGTTFGQLVAAVPTKLGDDLVAFAKSLVGLGSAPGGAAASAAAGVAQWSPQVLQALSMLGQPASLLNDVLHRMNQESGGNPQAVNRWDSNWQKGTPSVGLMQVIGPTFGAYAGPFADTGPFMYGTSIDPLANIYAGLNYALHDYPSLDYAMMKPGGYAAGGIVPSILSFDEGGMLPPGLTWNGTGAPEPVLNRQQWDSVMSGAGTASELLAAKAELLNAMRSMPAEIASEMDSVIQRGAVAHADRSQLLARTR